MVKIVNLTDHSFTIGLVIAILIILCVCVSFVIIISNYQFKFLE